MKKRFLRISNASLPETEQAKIERMAATGYAVEEITPRNIVFVKADSEKIRAKLVPFNIVGANYLGFVSKLREQGWNYNANDGFEHSLFICRDENAPEPVFNTQMVEKTIKRRIRTQGILASVGFVLMVITFMTNFSRLTDLGLNRSFFYAAWLTMNIQWTLAAISELRNLNILRGKCKRKSNAEYVAHILLNLATILFFIASFVVYIIYTREAIG